MEVPKSWGTLRLPLRWVAWLTRRNTPLPMCVTKPYLLVLYHKRYERMYGDTPIIQFLVFFVFRISGLCTPHTPPHS